jgi:hypothetical protein
MDMIFKNVFLIDDDRGKRDWNLNFATTTPSFSYIYQNFGSVFLFGTQVNMMLMVWL